MAVSSNAVGRPSRSGRTTKIQALVSGFVWSATRDVGVGLRLHSHVTLESIMKTSSAALSAQLARFLRSLVVRRQEL